ncbi:hypothetical protein NPIL_388621 [Nephila pilipes]|uniref:Uncharacterized protein n=1 Tax=Nephila pilipes TaxID=299642 RepID=A0A8X6QEC7_NEPPI|nr:hypothetical protein NPIL_388621 [Nephila pilipes]
MPAQIISFSGLQGNCNHMIAEHGDVFNTDLLFLIVVFQPLSTSRVHSVLNEAYLKLQNTIIVLETIYPHVSLHIDLLLIRSVFEPIFVYFARSLMLVLP